MPSASRQSFSDKLVRLTRFGYLLVGFLAFTGGTSRPLTINLIMTADVTAEHPIFNPQCMAVMEEVRKAIRGK